MRGRSAEAKYSGQAIQGCAECRWVVTAVCTVGTGLSGPEEDHCLGVFVGCPPLQAKFLVRYQQNRLAPFVDVDQYCYADPDGGVVTAATVAPDVRRYAAGLTVTTPTVRTWPPNDLTLVNLRTFFGATAPGSGQVTVGGQGYSLRIAIAATRYAWSFGDGASLITSDPGAGPPDGAAHHTYTTAGTYPVTVAVEYGATYSVVTPFGTFGPEIVPGGAVRTLPAQSDLRVREAHAGLTG